MMQTLAITLMIASLFSFLFLSVWYFYMKHLQVSWLKRVFHGKDSDLIAQNESKRKNDFKLKLLQAGLTKKQFNEIVIASLVGGLALFSLVFILKPEFMTEVAITFSALIIAIFTPYLYLLEQIKARVKRIDGDLSVFIDLLIIILEGGGGLNNAIDEVTVQAKNVIGDDLLEESKRFKYELISYGSETAFNNLVKRTGSESVGTIVGYMKLSEETGIGVKTIFENLAQEIRAAQTLEVEKRAATMNISLTFTMFIFILPAIIAMIAFAVASGELMKIV
ncbi:MAG: hypothetical protein FP820_08570 [Sulfurimonas sp.]|nr:hypothetical protein [Sulfurimonas sp.]MBU3939289.1 type II secretion system F family protein [bacterium]MBU4024112.1 type II secretion system F family protein [bacterium]MBU4058468.1 type II secretion system F family protein [bacterium]